MRATVTYQATDAPEKEWRRWYSDEDTEDTLEGRARRVPGIVGSWRRLSFWRDHEAVRIVMTNKRKEVTLRYSFENKAEVHEMLIGENDTPPQATLKAGKQGNFYVVDDKGVPFAKDDSLFGYATFPGSLPVQILHRSALKTLKTRPPYTEEG
jgi:hypothetical protein